VVTRLIQQAPAVPARRNGRCCRLPEQASAKQLFGSFGSWSSPFRVEIAGASRRTLFGNVGRLPRLESRET
jgi:hypothetical protein